MSLKSQIGPVAVETVDQQRCERDIVEDEHDRRGAHRQQDIRALAGESVVEAQHEAGCDDCHESLTIGKAAGQRQHECDNPFACHEAPGGRAIIRPGRSLHGVTDMKEQGEQGDGREYLGRSVVHPMVATKLKLVRKHARSSPPVAASTCLAVPRAPAAWTQMISSDVMTALAGMKKPEWRTLVIHMYTCASTSSST